MNPSFSDLPSSLLEVIMSLLSLKDNIFASAVCKSWCQAAVSTRVVEKHPWLLSFSNCSSSFELCDPVHSNLYTLHLPELAESAVCYSTHGWLLMHTPSSNDMFFFNPFTRERINLPKFALPFQATAFSCSPSSEDCVVVALNCKVQYCVAISTCRPGETEWITSVFPAVLLCFMQSNLVHLVDRFYCFTAGGGYLYSFLPSSRTWVCHEDAYYLYSFLPSSRAWDKKETFLAEKEGELFLMFTSGKEKPVVYKQGCLQWEEMASSELDGFTIFFSYCNSVMRTNLPLMNNNLCFSKFGDKRLHCVSYGFDKSRYNLHRESLNWLELDPRPNWLWIDPPPPENDLDYL